MGAALDREVERHSRSGDGPEWIAISLGRRIYYQYIGSMILGIVEWGK